VVWNVLAFADAGTVKQTRRTFKALVYSKLNIKAALEYLSLHQSPSPSSSKANVSHKTQPLNPSILSEALKKTYGINVSEDPNLRHVESLKEDVALHEAKELARKEYANYIWKRNHRRATMVSEIPFRQRWVADHIPILLCAFLGGSCRKPLRSDCRLS
jgi:hypothetical protein